MCNMKEFIDLKPWRVFCAFQLYNETATHEKMFVISHWGNADFNHSTYHCTPVIMAKIKNNDRTKCHRGSKETRSLIHPGNVKSYINSGKQFSSFLLSETCSYPGTQQVRLLDICRREMEIMFTQNLYMNVYNLFIHSSPKLETTDMSFKNNLWPSIP